MSRYCCPDCHAPIRQPKRGHDARCKACRDALPVNGRWPVRDTFDGSGDGFSRRD